ncbi:acetamidase/formamidase family protein [Bacillus sp. DJP31]|uniref:acetamidase/formamidase family protein n=1 Tax=Bacillus sp. DJP31 TaxID=3409789 RepID=UPI003BB56849
MSYVTQTLSKEHFIYAFSKEHNPVLRVLPGSSVVINTYDCFQDQIQTNSTRIQAIDWDQINPATGPIFVEGAVRGDILKVTIDNIELGNQGVMAVGPNLGVLGHRIDQFEAKVMPIENGFALFNERVKIPLTPMIGVIGVAPENEPVSCGTPGAHGGNMDTTLITTGSTLYLPIFQDGALFGLGDLHAAMGDGEIGVSGIEIAGKVTVTLDVIKGYSIRIPFVQNREGIASLVSAETLDDAAKQAVEEMIDLLLPYTDLSLNHITMILSAVGQSQISQMVDPLLTARFFVPNLVLEAYNIQLFQDY